MSRVSDIIDEFGIDDVSWDFSPSYNIAPGQDIPGIVIEEGKVLKKFRWGLIPFWADEPSIGYRMINARAETVDKKRSFREPFKKRRCIIPADGFYEWKKMNGGKTPHYYYLRSGSIMGLAGIYEEWKSDKGNKIISCTILTTEPNEIVKKVHNRMPVILEKKYRDEWLDSSIEEMEKLKKMLNPYNPDKMDSHEVSKRVNSYKFNNPECIRPVSNPENRKTLF